MGEDSQAPPDLEPVEVQQQNFSDMAQFGEGTYEPSADELIDVLKNLENLAAANPALYRAIVDQIKGNQPMHDPRYEGEQTNGHHEPEPHMEQGYSDEVDRHEQEMYH